MAGLYCGPPMAPADLAGAWRFDPIAAALILLLLWLGRGAPRTPLLAAAGLLALLYLSPLCALAAALFSARAVHHVLLVAMAAPLLALCLPAHRITALPLGAAVALHTLAFWAWHLPAAYQFGIVGALPYWTMQATLLATAVLAWRRILDAPPAAALLALLTLSVQMGMLGALLTFAERPLYPAHLATTAPFGLSALDDQRLAGLVMWVPGALPYLAAAAAIAWTRLRRAEAGAR